jgi:hypothetical protein
LAASLLETFACVWLVVGKLKRQLRRLFVAGMQPIKLGSEIVPVIAQFHDRNNGPKMFSQLRISDVARQPLEV